MAKKATDFLIIGAKVCTTYKNVFVLIKNGKMTQKTSISLDFVTPGDDKNSSVNISWYTSLATPDREPLELTKRYSEELYPKYSNYDAIDVGSYKDIPYDYDGVMGVPVNFIDFYCKKQFDLIGHEHDVKGNGGSGVKEGQFEVNGVGVFKRILIKRKQL